MPRPLKHPDRNRLSDKEAQVVNRPFTAASVSRHLADAFKNHPDFPSRVTTEITIQLNFHRAQVKNQDREGRERRRLAAENVRRLGTMLPKFCAELREQAQIMLAVEHYKQTGGDWKAEFIPHLSVENFGHIAALMERDFSADSFVADYQAAQALLDAVQQVQARADTLFHPAVTEHLTDRWQPHATAIWKMLNSHCNDADFKNPGASIHRFIEIVLPGILGQKISLNKIRDHLSRASNRQ